jgi:hypothetical protein
MRLDRLAQHVNVLSIIGGNMKGVTIWRLSELRHHCKSDQANVKECWCPVRPIGWTALTKRIKAAWLAFTGLADVVIWPQGQ